MKKIFCLCFFISSIIICAIGAVLCPIDVMIRCVMFICLMYIFCEVIYLTNVGKYYLSILRGFFWGIRLAGFPIKFKVEKDVTIFNPKCVSVGQSVKIGKGAVIAPLGKYSGKSYPSRIVIGNRVSIGAMDRIAAMQEVIIEDDVLFAAFVHITDHSHEFKNVGMPISHQGVYSKGPVRIKRGAWLAFGCHILSGVTIGEYSVVAANSVVTKDVPAYTVVAGNPARIVKYYDFSTNSWISPK